MAENTLKNRRALIVGSTGLLGKALVQAGRSVGFETIGLARRGAEIACDATDVEALAATVSQLNPGIVINAAAITNLNECEDNPNGAWLVNARIPATLAEICFNLKSGFVQISTDHYYLNDGMTLHNESAPIRLVNEYARTKYAGEALALTLPGTLIIRTNITGWRGWLGKPTFFEWVVESLETQTPMTLFNDFYTSTIDAPSCARHIFSLIDLHIDGTVNLAARDVATKEAFVLATARALGVSSKTVKTGSVISLKPRRAESLGLDVSKAERILGIRLPDMEEVIASLISCRSN